MFAQAYMAIAMGRSPSLILLKTRAESVRKKIRILPTYADANMGHPFDLITCQSKTSLFRLLTRPVERFS